MILNSVIATFGVSLNQAKTVQLCVKDWSPLLIESILGHSKSLFALLRGRIKMILLNLTFCQNSPDVS